MAYTLVATDTALASVIPSNSARAGGIVFPIARSVAEAYNSHPGPTRRRLGSFLMTAVYQAEVVACAMFLTSQASNVIIARFALAASGFELTYSRWLIGAIVPGLVSLLSVVYLIYRINPPEVTHTPQAVALARETLERMGPMSRNERVGAGGLFDPPHHAVAVSGPGRECLHDQQIHRALEHRNRVIPHDSSL